MSDIRYSIDGQILTDMADVIRTHKGLVTATCKITSMGHQNQATQRTENLSAKLLKGMTYKMTFKVVYARNNADQYYRATPTIKENNADGAVIYQGLVKQDSETVIIFTAAADITAIHVSIGENCFLNIGDVKIEPSDAEGNLISYFTPQQMVDVVSAALPTKQDLVITGDCNNLFSKGKNAWMLRCYIDLLTTNKIYNTSYMFNEYTGESIPFDLNWESAYASSYNSSTEMFSYCRNLKVVPKLNNWRSDNISAMFQYCERIREIPEDFFDTWDWSLIDNATSSYSGQMSRFVANCASLRKYPMELLRHGNKLWTSATYVPFYYFVNGCSVLDELVNVPKPANSDAAITSNLFSYSLDYAYRLKDFTFAPGITLNWKNQTLDLSNYVGYANIYYIDSIYKYNSGITADKEVKDDETYQALKNDPDWFTGNIDYSRYNHDSAVKTINSLPTMLGTGNTIKFKGAAGAKTDGGAINTLTESEIAVATAKGWTVTLV